MGHEEIIRESRKCFQRMKMKTQPTKMSRMKLKLCVEGNV